MLRIAATGARSLALSLTSLKTSIRPHKINETVESQDIKDNSVDAPSIVIDYMGTLTSLPIVSGDRTRSTTIPTVLANRVMRYIGHIRAVDVRVARDKAYQVIRTSRPLRSEYLGRRRHRRLAGTSLLCVGRTIPIHWCPEKKGR